MIAAKGIHLSGADHATISDNGLHDKGLPGVAMHSHTPGQNLNDNVIVGNIIYNNAADTDDAATPGTTGINVFGVSWAR